MRKVVLVLLLATFNIMAADDCSLKINQSDVAPEIVEQLSKNGFTTSHSSEANFYFGYRIVRKIYSYSQFKAIQRIIELGNEVLIPVDLEFGLVQSKNPNVFKAVYEVQERLKKINEDQYEKEYIGMSDAIASVVAKLPTCSNGFVF